MRGLWQGLDQSQLCHGHGQGAWQSRYRVPRALLPNPYDERMGKKMMTFVMILVVTLLFIIYWLLTRILLLVGSNMALIKMLQAETFDEDLAREIALSIPALAIARAAYDTIKGKDGVIHYGRK